MASKANLSIGSSISSVHYQNDRADLAARIRALRPESARQWGKMTVIQMLEHCQLFDRWIQSGEPNRQTLMGKLVGRAVLRRMLRPDKAMARNVPTMPALMSPGGTEFSAAQAAWLTSLEAYADYEADVFVHDFFGPLSYDELGAFVWKHADHHLKQFRA